MTFTEMMTQNYGLSEEQAGSLKTELKKLEKFFDDNFEDEPSFFQAFYDKFKETVTPYGFKDEEQAEPLLDDMYRQQDFQILVTYVIPAFYNSGGDKEVFYDTYESMQNHH